MRLALPALALALATACAGLPPEERILAEWVYVPALSSPEDPYRVRFAASGVYEAAVPGDCGQGLTEPPGFNELGCEPVGAWELLQGELGEDDRAVASDDPEAPWVLVIANAFTETHRYLHFQGAGFGWSPDGERGPGVFTDSFYRPGSEPGAD